MDKPNRILIIDDEDVVLDSCQQVLGSGGYQLATARAGVEGLKLVPEFAPDLVLVDLMMPGLSGFEVLEAIRALDPTIVAIVITGYSTVGSAVEAMKKGAFDFLPKPFTPDELRLITARGLEKRRLVLEAIELRREREMLRENFAAIVSHELKSPLSAVQQNLYGLAAELAEQLSEAQRSRFERLETRIADLLKLIQTWLRAVSVPVAKIKESFAPVSVHAVIDKAIETVQPQAVRKNLEISATIADPLPPVLGDEGSLTEALVNLIGNSVKYTHAGGKIFVKAGTDAGQVLISVADTGVGIAPEDLPRVFGDFFRGRTAPAAESGSGLGLALTRRIIEAHEGTIAVESEVGKGTTFSIRLPVHEAGKPESTPKVAAVSSTRDPGDVP